MTKFRQTTALCVIFALASPCAVADQGAFTNGVPQATALTGAEEIPADTTGGSEAILASQIASLGATGQLDKGNWLIGGDATTNLWQRGTTGTSVTTALTYGGPDRWAYWSGASTAMTVSRVAGALSGQFGFKMARTAGQTGIVQVCMEQVLESGNAVQLEGQTVELDFDAVTGSNFSPASANMTAYVVTGTGSNEGSAAMAKGLNGGGGGASAWSGQANATAAVIGLGGVNVTGRYAAVAAIPNNVQEVGVALCFTPVGTAGANDFVTFSHLQLTKNPALVGKVSAVVGYSCASLACSPAFGRLAFQEALLQWRYYWELDEPASGINAEANCRSHSVTVADCLVLFPVPLRKVPTMTYVAGFAVETVAGGGTLNNCSALATSVTLAAAPSVSSVEVSCTAAVVPAAGVAGPLWSNAGSGKVIANAEL